MGKRTGSEEFLRPNEPDVDIYQSGECITFVKINNLKLKIEVNIWPNYFFSKMQIQQEKC